MGNFVSINISYIRKKNQLNQGQLAAKFRLGATSIGAYERGKNEPPLSFVIKFCDLYELSIDDFVKKNLEELDKSDYYIKEPQEEYKLGEGTKNLYERLIEDKQEIIESKNAIISTKDQQIQLLTKEVEKLNVLLNQNSQ